MSKKDKPTLEGSGFGSLAGFEVSNKPKSVQPKEVTNNVPVVAKPEVQADVVLMSQAPKVVSGHEDETITRQSRHELSPVDENDFNRVIQLLNIDVKEKGLNIAKHSLASKSGNSNRYYRIKEFFSLANRCDVENFYNYHNLKHEASLSPEINEIFKKLIIRGYKSQAIGWIKSLTAEGLKYGTVPGNSTPSVQEKKDFRIAEARKFAEKAGTTVETLVAENKLEYILRG